MRCSSSLESTLMLPSLKEKKSVFFQTAQFFSSSSF